MEQKWILKEKKFNSWDSNLVKLSREQSFSFHCSQIIPKFLHKNKKEFWKKTDNIVAENRYAVR